jgi:RNA polymerase sigma factor (sigma-70 family)
VTLFAVQPIETDDFATWYEAARPRVLATLILVTGDTHRAAEATDEAFVRALARWGSVSQMQSRVGWTVRVGINLVRRRERRARLEATLLRREVPRGDVPAAAGEAWLAVAGLPPRQREVLVLRYVADLTEIEIARSIGVSRSAVSSALTDARRALASLLTEPQHAPASRKAPPEVRHV